MSYTTYGWNILVDQVQLLLKYLKDIGIDAKAIQQEYGAYIATTVQGGFIHGATGRRRRSSTPTISSTARTCRASPRTRAT